MTNKHKENPLIKQYMHHMFIFFLFFMMAMKITEAKVTPDGIETTEYQIEISTSYCAFSIFVNDLKVLSNTMGRPSLSGSVTISEYLKAQDNIISIDVWDPSREDDQFTEGAYCRFTLKARDRTKPEGANTFTAIDFKPSGDNTFNTSGNALIEPATSITTWGEATTPVMVTYDSDDKYYRLERHFDIQKDFIVWQWANSAVLKTDTGELTAEQTQKLQQAYSEYWHLLQTKDIEGIKRLHHELLSESAQAGSFTADEYFETMGITDIFTDPEFADYQLEPLRFTPWEVEFALDNRAVFLKRSPLRIVYQNKTSTWTLNPRFRWNGERFIITR